ncbi:efflux RND transporter permease subunit [Streptomyces sp. NPDC058457]|uniref:efflux RND transporter permease subunit n=1 Tax=Streptomyces sp. NPDC058457 TaxID=3346507 RepID=UPI00364AAAE3
MPWLSRVSIANRKLAALITILVVALGVYAVPSLKQQLLPDLSFPAITVTATYPGATPQVVEDQVVEPTEDAVKGVHSIQTMTSTSRQGSATVSLQFDFGVDTDEKSNEVQRALSKTSTGLPDGVDPQVVTGGTDDQPTITLAATSDAGQQELAAQLEDKVVPELKTIDGVNQVTVSGERDQVLRRRPGRTVRRLRAGLPQRHPDPARRYRPERHRHGGRAGRGCAVEDGRRRVVPGHHRIRGRLPGLGQRVQQRLLQHRPLVADWGGTDYAWSDPVVLGLAAAGVAAWALFFRSQSRAAEPVIPLRLFRSPIFVIATLIGMIVIGVGMFAVISYLPTYLLMVYGVTATESGWLLPMVVGLMAASLTAGQRMRRTGRYKAYPIAGGTVVTVTALLLSGIDVDTPLVLLCGYLFLMGVGIGLMMQTLVLAVQNAFPAADVGTATSASSFFREIGATVGTAAVGAVFTSRLADQLGSRLSAADLKAVGDTDSLTPALVHALPDRIQETVIAAYQHALTPVFGCLVPLFAVGVVLAVVLPEKRLAGGETDRLRPPGAGPGDRRAEARTTG